MKRCAIRRSSAYTVAGNCSAAGAAWRTSFCLPRPAVEDRIVIARLSPLERCCRDGCLRCAAPGQRAFSQAAQESWRSFSATCAFMLDPDPATSKSNELEIEMLSSHAPLATRFLGHLPTAPAPCIPIDP